MSVSVSFDRSSPTPPIEQGETWCQGGNCCKQIACIIAITSLALAIISGVAFLITGSSAALSAAIGFGVICLIASGSTSSFSISLPRGSSNTSTTPSFSPVSTYNPTLSSTRISVGGGGTPGLSSNPWDRVPVGPRRTGWFF